MKAYQEERFAKYDANSEQKKAIRVMCREIQLGAASANIALAHSGLDLGAINHERFGVDFGAKWDDDPFRFMEGAEWTPLTREGRRLHRITA